jgi:transposase
MREEGQVSQAKRKSVWMSLITPSDTPILIEIVKKVADWSYNEMTALWCRRPGKTVSRPATIRKLKKLGYTRKKSRIRQSESPPKSIQLNGEDFSISVKISRLRNQFSSMYLTSRARRTTHTVCPSGDKQ